MAKYYVQSGKVRFLVEAADAEGAALWVVNQTINDHSPVAGTDEQGTVDCLIQSADFPAPEILVSEIGFGRREAAVISTERLLEHWCQLIQAMNHLLDQLDD